MDQEFKATIESEWRKRYGEAVSIQRTQGVNGGCINQTTHVWLDNGLELLIKANRQVSSDFFAREAEGLRAIQATETIRTLRVYWSGVCQSTSTSYLVLEWIRSGLSDSGFSLRFARQLADFHRSGKGSLFGFDHNNFLGATEQQNRWASSWLEFWATNRIEFQLKLAKDNRLSSRDLTELGNRLLQQIPEILSGENEPPTLIHGDLWGGNYLVDQTGNPVLIDPAPYYGKREAELAMTTLFGGFDAAFQSAYRDAWPLAPDSERRIEMYQLYHLLNHLNLFGSSYLGGCLALMKRLL